MDYSVTPKLAPFAFYYLSTSNFAPEIWVYFRRICETPYLAFSPKQSGFEPGMLID